MEFTERAWNSRYGMESAGVVLVIWAVASGYWVLISKYPPTMRLLVRSFGSHGWPWPLGFPWDFWSGQALTTYYWHGLGGVMFNSSSSSWSNPTSVSTEVVRRAGTR